MRIAIFMSKNKHISKLSAVTMLGLTVAGPVLGATTVLAQEVNSNATNLKDAQGKSKENSDNLTKTGQVEGKAMTLDVPKTALTDALNAYKGNVTLEKGDTVDRGTLKQSDTEGIAKATDEITKDYQNQANEIKTLSDKYEADLKFYNDNKAKVADLTAQLTKTVQDAQKLGAKIDKKQEISGKSFEEIQKNLQDQITAMKALAEKQGKANTDYANASSDYATKSEEIKKLEAQLETLAKQGTDLGAKVSKGNVTDSKTLDEIKSLLTEQVKTISDLATKQKAINDKFDADTKAWNDGQAEAQKLTDELTKTAGELQKAGADVKTGQAESGKSWDEIKAGLQTQIAEAKKVKAAQDTTNANTSAADADYQAKLAQYTKDKAQYDKDKAEYDKKKTQYDKDKAAYDTAKTKYDKDKAEYDAALASLGANINKDGWLSEAIGQSLIFKSEPNANLVVTKNGQNVGPEQTLSKGETIVATYTNLKDSTYAGEKIAKVVYTYTAKDNEGDFLQVSNDPTITIHIKSNHPKAKGVSSRVGFKAEFFKEDGSKITFSNQYPAIIAFNSLNKTRGLVG